MERGRASKDRAEQTVGVPWPAPAVRPTIVVTMSRNGQQHQHRGRAPKLVRHLAGHDWVAMRALSTDVAEPRPPVVHDHATVMLLLGGRMRFWMHGVYELGIGDVLLVPAGTPHYVVDACDARSIGASVCLTCAPAGVRDALGPLVAQVSRGGCASRRLSPEACERLEKVMRELEGELAHAGAGRDVAVEALVSLVSVAIVRAEEGPRLAQQASSPLVVEALAYVQHHAISGISLRDVAKHVARSPAHVASVVKDETGETVVGWITRARMSACRKLMLHTDETIELVAERCGFASASHFHRAFKRAHGTSPGEWRRTKRA